MTANECTACGRPVEAHRIDGEWIGCVPPSPLTVTVAGHRYVLRTPRDIYRLCARLKKAAA